MSTASVVFYISGHGFGHASREVEVLNALGPDLDASHTRVIIRSAVSPSLLARTLTVPYDLRPGACDTGVVQSDSITHDDAQTLVNAELFHRDLDARADAEARDLATDGVRLIVGDIPPLAFETAARLGVPSLAIANFTWDWIYEGYPRQLAQAPRLVPRIRAAYAHATLALRLPFAGDFSTFPTARDLPLIARHSTQTRADTRAHFGLPADRPLALLSFGGYGLPSLDPSRIDCLGEWGVVVTDRVSREATRGAARHVHRIDEGQLAGRLFRYEDLVAAVDAVVTKPGYGILAECIAAGVPILYTSRGEFREYDVMVRDMPRYVRSRFISHSDLFAGRLRGPLEALLSQPQPAETLATNGAAAAVRIITRLSGLC